MKSPAASLLLLLPPEGQEGTNTGMLGFVQISDTSSNVTVTTCEFEDVSFIVGNWSDEVRWWVEVVC